MEQLRENVEAELRELLKKYFLVGYLHETAVAYLEVKLKETLLFSKLCVIHYRMFAGEQTDIYRAAASIELMILGLDIIDDLQDQDQPSIIWCQTPPEISLNIAIGFLTLAHQGLLDCDFPQDRLMKASEIMNRQMLTAINGQTLDLMNESKNEEEYISIIEQKSSALLISACMIGVILACGDWNEKVAVYINEVGIAAQMKNDLRDLLNWEEKNDFLHRKRTVPTLYLLKMAANEEQDWLIDYFNGKGTTEGILSRRQEIEQICNDSGTLLYSSARMRTHYYKFLELVDQMELEAHWKELLLLQLK
ncbi:polyprenyl synthetase family protein [Paenibacillus sp. Marseille-Q9583]